MEATTSRKRMAGAADSRFSSEEKAEDLSPVTTLEIDTTVANGKRYAGKFKFKVPTLGTTIDIGCTRAAYLDQTEGSDPVTMMLAEMLAFLHHTIEEDDTNPAWWKETNRGVNLYHMDPISDLYKAAKVYQVKYLGPSPEVDETKKSTDEQLDEDGSSTVGGDVQSTPERRTIMEIDGKGGIRTGSDDAGDPADESGVGQRSTR